MKVKALAASIAMACILPTGTAHAGDGLRAFSEAAAAFDKANRRYERDQAAQENRELVRVQTEALRVQTRRQLYAECMVEYPAAEPNERNYCAQDAISRAP